MVEVKEQGLFIIENGEVKHIHTSSKKEDDLETLRDYLKEWDLEV